MVYDNIKCIWPPCQEWTQASQVDSHSRIFSLPIESKTLHSWGSREGNKIYTGLCLKQAVRLWGRKVQPNSAELHSVGNQRQPEEELLLSAYMWNLYLFWGSTWVLRKSPGKVWLWFKLWPCPPVFSGCGTPWNALSLVAVVILLKVRLAKLCIIAVRGVSAERQQKWRTGLFTQDIQPLHSTEPDLIQEPGTALQEATLGWRRLTPMTQNLPTSPQ